MTKNSTDKVYITQTVMVAIRDTVGRHPAETGGILGADTSSVISHYYFDHSGISKETGYTPDVTAVNKILADRWMPNNVLMVGIVHSHANMNCVPSCGDISYGIRILQALDTVDKFYLPIVTQTPNGVCMNFYVMLRDSERGFVCKQIEYAVIDE